MSRAVGIPVVLYGEDVKLVLCSVDDPDRAIAEARRVLKPGGALRFLEHVRAPTAGWARAQDAVTPLWRRIGAGCQPNRDTLATIERGGFHVAELVSDERGGYPTRPLARGVATRPG